MGTVASENSLRSSSLATFRGKIYFIITHEIED